MNLRNALGWSTAQTIMRLGLGVISAKISAVYLGPPGVALVGQLTSFIQALQGTIGNAAGTAVVNLTATTRNDPVGLKNLWGTAFRLVVLIALMTLIVTAAGASPIAKWLLADGAYWPTIVLAASAVVLVVIDTIVTSALNGLRQPDLIAKTAIASSVVEVSTFVSLVYFFGLWGGLVGCAAIYAVKLAITLGSAFGFGKLALSDFSGSYSTDSLRQIARFYPMLIAHSIALPIAQILVRNSVIDNLGIESGGYLQAVWRLSDMYVGVMTAAMGLFFMAHYSSLTSDSERSAILRRTVLQLFGLTALAAGAVYLLRDFIITIILTQQFMPMGDLLPFHLGGDVIKMMGYPLQMALVAQRRMAWYIGQAIAGPATFAALSNVLVSSIGDQAAPVAYFISHILVLLILGLALRAVLFKRLVTSNNQN